VNLSLHEGDGIAHVHELTLDQKGKLTEYIWKVENVELTTVGIDIGSSTSHLMFARVRLQRKTQALSSQFVVIERSILWKSPILLTPFLDDGSIDAVRLGDFIADSYAAAGIAPKSIDTGAVILTGEAIKRTNARAIAELFAGDSGRFVCASAGHHLESVLAAHGSGAVALSRENATTILNIDIGGGTTKLAVVRGGNVVATCAFAVGGRLLAFDADGVLERMDESASLAAAAIGVRLAVGASGGRARRGRDLDHPRRAGDRPRPGASADRAAAVTARGGRDHLFRRSVRVHLRARAARLRRYRASAGGAHRRGMRGRAHRATGRRAAGGHSRHRDRRLAIHHAGERLDHLCLADGDAAAA